MSKIVITESQYERIFNIKDIPFSISKDFNYVIIENELFDITQNKSLGRYYNPISLIENKIIKEWDTEDWIDLGIGGLSTILDLAGGATAGTTSAVAKAIDFLHGLSFIYRGYTRGSDGYYILGLLSIASVMIPIMGSGAKAMIIGIMRQAIKQGDNVATIFKSLSKVPGIKLIIEKVSGLGSKLKGLGTKFSKWADEYSWFGKIWNPIKNTYNSIVDWFTKIFKGWKEEAKALNKAADVPNPGAKPEMPVGFGSPAERKAAEKWAKDKAKYDAAQGLLSKGSKVAGASSMYNRLRSLAFQWLKKFEWMKKFLNSGIMTKVKNFFSNKWVQSLFKEIKDALPSNVVRLSNPYTLMTTTWKLAKAIANKIIVEPIKRFTPKTVKEIFNSAFPGVKLTRKASGRLTKIFNTIGSTKLYQHLVNFAGYSWLGVWVNNGLCKLGWKSKMVQNFDYDVTTDLSWVTQDEKLQDEVKSMKAKDPDSGLIEIFLNVISAVGDGLSSLGSLIVDGIGMIIPDVRNIFNDCVPDSEKNGAEKLWLNIHNASSDMMGFSPALTPELQGISDVVGDVDSKKWKELDIDDDEQVRYTRKK